MAQKRIFLTVIGTRPEAIKMAPLITALCRDDRFDSKLCVSGQHKEMLKQVLDLFEIQPDYDLEVMRSNQTPAEVASRILTGLQKVFSDTKPDLILVHGDTITASAASFAAYLNGIDVGHVEAGLRTGNLAEPWPEEGNRRMIGSIAQYHFAPTQAAAGNLRRENLEESNILITGNTVIDALLEIQAKVRNNHGLRAEIDRHFSFLDRAKRTCLVTIHRRESFGSGLQDVCRALSQLAVRNKDLQIVIPVHPNPNISERILNLLGNVDGIHLIDPQDYLHFVCLMERADIILTDSGGIQEEAPALGKPVLVLRNKTERPEAVDAGTVRLVGTDCDTIISETQILLDNTDAYNNMARAHNPYGDGKSVSRILNFLGNI